MDLWLLLSLIIAYVIWLAIWRCVKGESGNDKDSGNHGDTGDENTGESGKDDSNDGGSADNGEDSGTGQSEGTGEDSGDCASGNDGGENHSGNPWERNLLKNNCGQDDFQHWKIMMNGGDGWIVEKIPTGVQPLPNQGSDSQDFGESTGCFATGGDMCLKEQLIDLLEEGFTEHELDSQPLIHISEWHACHLKELGDYVLNVTLLNKDKKSMRHFNYNDDFSTLPREWWHKVSTKFNRYGVGLRYISFNHGGKSRRKLPGHYGCRISGGVIKFERGN